MKTWKDALTAVRRRIVEECTHAGVDLSTVKGKKNTKGNKRKGGDFLFIYIFFYIAVSGNVTPQALLSLAAQLHRKLPFKHTHLMQLMGILVKTAHLAPVMRWDPLMAIEKVCRLFFFLLCLPD